jgi:hypothetical protein
VDAEGQLADPGPGGAASGLLQVDEVELQLETHQPAVVGGQGVGGDVLPCRADRVGARGQVVARDRLGAAP